MKINLCDRKCIPANYSHESKLLLIAGTPATDSARSSYLTGFQGQLLKVLPRASFPWAWAFTARKNFVYGKRFRVCFEVRKSIRETFSSIFFLDGKTRDLLKRFLSPAILCQSPQSSSPSKLVRVHRFLLALFDMVPGPWDLSST